MAQTQCVIVYSPNLNIRRSVIIPSDDSQVAHHATNLVKGEAALIGTLADYNSIGPDAMLAAHTAQQPSSDRCIIVSPNALGTILGAVRADPAIDTHPAGTLVLHPTALVGGTYKNAVYVAPVAVSAPLLTAAQKSAGQAELLTIQGQVSAAEFTAMQALMAAVPTQSAQIVL